MASLSRRDLFRFLTALPITYATPLGCGFSGAPPPYTAGFFSDVERTALGALADAVLPPDDEPGGAALGAVPYIERLLTAFDVDPPAIFAGGPFSGRAPTPASNGAPSSTFPSNDFANFLPLDSVSERAWRLRLYGSRGVAGGAPNEALLGEVVGLRDAIKNGLAAAIKDAPQALEVMLPADLSDYFNRLEVSFRTLVIELVFQAAFAAPEYGGNPGLRGWKMVHYEGDVQPLGYSIFSTDANGYKERADAPMSTANVGPDPQPMSADTIAFIDNLVAVLGGRKLP